MDTLRLKSEIRDRDPSMAMLSPRRGQKGLAEMESSKTAVNSAARFSREGRGYQRNSRLIRRSVDVMEEPHQVRDDVARCSLHDAALRWPRRTVAPSPVIR